MVIKLCETGLHEGRHSMILFLLLYFTASQDKASEASAAGL